MEQNQSSSNGSVPPEPLMYKSRLNEFTQQTGIPVPVYESVNEGLQHLPKFRCTVHVDGVAYRSVNTFRNRKDAEQDASKLALESMPKKIKDESSAIVYEDKVYCKCILNEFAAKVNLPTPTYTTTQLEPSSTFICSLVFDGKTYTGPIGRSKKEAERLAARVAIRSILGTSDSGIYLSKIIKSKSTLFEAPLLVAEPQIIHDTCMATVAIPGSNCRGILMKRKASQTLAEDVTAPLPPSHEIGNIAILLNQPKPSAASHISEDPYSVFYVGGTPSNSKKKKKKQKKSRDGSQLCMTPSSQTPPSVAL
ncbi:hypothetical protein C5167_020393 [Papaver somniferum]|uniref:DRBM domain-containing protein n=1 Tax=Papaver somniferum TaxID=3469 RepID=A0A4Y7ITF9_PAPSO|nr:double-stranded RNA-binding protein 4-like isoform X1 [Papaver somniferum]XP_026449463.1 double-stranded RNA-binding protein 4-like isoform X1 [Papaver somniferum]XP_026449464.1 double-stranded RNA-binding protein 4-like isoform X1 [Papaver somniferum]RZC51967.1 hypothetical protein C5167_020393 [Papaver somniferum]